MREISLSVIGECEGLLRLRDRGRWIGDRQPQTLFCSSLQLPVPDLTEWGLLQWVGCDCRLSGCGEC